MVITGTLNTVFLKLQNSAFERILNQPFSHPWFQSILMFIGEFYCALLWLCLKGYFRRSEQLERERALAQNPHMEDVSLPDAPPWLFMISCGCDLIGSTLLNFALLNMAGSIFQMLRGGIIIVTCVFMIIFLKKSPRNFEWLGVGFVFLGVFMVGLASQIDPDNGSGDETNILGILMLVFSLLFQGFQFIYQERILIKYKCHPMQLVAWEGTWGLIAFLIILPIFEFIPCNFGGREKVCSVNQDGEYFLEQTVFAFEQMVDKIPILIYTIGQTFSICGFNFFGIMLVKYSSAATRSVMDSTRTVLVWVFFLLVPMANGSTLEHFLWLQLAGFVVMLFGQIVFNGIVKIPILGFDKHFKKTEDDALMDQNLLTKEGSVKNKSDYDA